MYYSDLNTEQQMIAETKKFVNNKQRELTQAQYDALTTEEKNNGTIYFITDSENPSVDSYTKSEVNSLLNDKVDKENGKGLSTNDYTTAEKTKLTGIEAGANKTVVDSSMSTTSENPLQNKVITAELAGTKTATGNPITVTDAAPVNAVNLSMDLEPIQDLHGYDHPWVGGAGKNKLPIMTESESIYGVDFTVLKDSANNKLGITVNNTLNRTHFGYEFAQFTLAAGSYILTGIPLNTEIPTHQIIIYSDDFSKTIAFVNNINQQSAAFTLTEAQTIRVQLYVYQATYSNAKVYPMIRLSTETDSSFAPYTNICPISGRTEEIITQKDNPTNPTVTKTYTIQFGQTVYGGTLDVTKGELVVDTAKWTANTSTMNNTEEFPGWTGAGIRTLIDDRVDATLDNQTMNVGTSLGINTTESYDIVYLPTTAYGKNQTEWKALAQDVEVIVELATPFTIPLTPQQIKLLENTNTLYTDYEGDTITIEYQPNNAIGEAVRVVEESYETRVSLLESRNTAKVYGFHISSTESDPSAKVTYLADAVGMTPAHMNFSTGKFDYGSWEDVWFVRDTKPCLLNINGNVDLYLDKNDFTKDEYGNGRPISENTQNLMIEFPKIWYKVVPDSDGYGASVYIAPIKIDEDYVDYPYIDYLGRHKEHFYMPAYNGSTVTAEGTTRMRSFPGDPVSKSNTAQQEINYCKANGNGWYTEDAGEIILINFLLVLMGKSTDTQTVYGQGLHTGGTGAINDGFRTGIHDQKGMFYGTNSGAIASGSYGNAVKVFGMENYWGFQWRRYAGDINDNGTRKIKLCYGNEDGSTTFDYNTNGTGYVDVGATPSGAAGGYINKMKFTHDGMYSQVSSGSSSTHYCDGQWVNNAQVNYAFHGGASNSGLCVGAICVDLGDAASIAWWTFGAALSYK